jgi:hypothetical protein
VTTDGRMIDIVYRLSICDLADRLMCACRTAQLPSLAGAV